MQYEVEWTSEVPLDEYGDRDIDRAVNKYRRFPSKSLAMAFARKISGDSFWGCAYLRALREVSRAEIEPDEDGCCDVETFWIERGKLLGYIGQTEEVEA